MYTTWDRIKSNLAKKLFSKGRTNSREIWYEILNEMEDSVFRPIPFSIFSIFFSFPLLYNLRAS